MILLYIVHILSLIGICVLYTVMHTRNLKRKLKRANKDIEWWQSVTDSYYKAADNWRYVAQCERSNADGWKSRLVFIAKNFRVQANQKGTGKYIYLTTPEITQGDFSRTTKAKQCN